MTHPNTPKDALEGALTDLLAQGWGGSSDEVEKFSGEAPVDSACSPAPLEYPPLPEREAVVLARRPDVPRRVPAPPLTRLEPQPHGGALMRTETEEDDEADEPVPARRQMMDVGLLSDLAAGRKSAEEVARETGTTPAQVQSNLASALREVSPAEIARAMGLQAAEQQLKSGAIFGVVLGDLVADMAAGRLKPENKLKLAELLAKLGRIEPKEDKQSTAGMGFVLNISLGETVAPVTIDMETTQ